MSLESVAVKRHSFVSRWVKLTDMNWRAIGAVEVRRTSDGFELGRLEWGDTTLWVCSCAGYLANTRWNGDPRCQHTDENAAYLPSTA